MLLYLQIWTRTECFLKLMFAGTPDHCGKWPEKSRIWPVCAIYSQWEEPQKQLGSQRGSENNQHIQVHARSFLQRLENRPCYLSEALEGALKWPVRWLICIFTYAISISKSDEPVISGEPVKTDSFQRFETCMDKQSWFAKGIPLDIRVYILFFWFLCQKLLCNGHISSKFSFLVNLVGKYFTWKFSTDCIQYRQK